MPARPRPALAALLPAALLLALATLTADAPPARLEVGWIAREPRIQAPATADGPVDAGWPEAGSIVHWVAHLLNRRGSSVRGVAYVWRIDDEVAGRGRIDLPPGETTVALPWKWTFARHRISLGIVPPAGAGDNADDNEVTVDSDALALGLWVERSVYDWLLRPGKTDFERFFQQQIDNWNGILARAVYGTTPHGVLDRIRLDQVTVVPDGTRLRSEDLLDVDLHWMFYTGADSRFLQPATRPPYDADQTIVLHELLHQRGLTDLYAYYLVHHFGDRTRTQVNITENGKLVAGSYLMPPLLAIPGDPLLYRRLGHGVMASSYLGQAHLTEHSADGLNWWAGRRTPLSLDQWGNLIDQWSNGRTPKMYVRQVPERTEVRLVDQNGAPVPGAAVDVYLDYGEGFYVETFNAAPDRTLTTEGRGVVTLTRETLLGAPTPYGPKPQIVILGVRSGRGRGFGFIPMIDFNMLFFRQLGEVPPPPPPDADADAGGGVTAPVVPADADPPPPVPSTTLRVTLHPW